MAVTAMGWNQIVSVQPTAGGNWAAIKVSDYSVGIKNDFEVPALISGLTDKITWSKGMITVEGDISAPLTQSLSSKLLKYGLYINGALNQINVKCTISNPVNNAMINSFSITATSGEYIQTKVSLWGVLNDTGHEYQSDYGGIDPPSVDINSSAIYFGIGGAGGLASADQTNTSTGYGATYGLEQIPMFDQVTGVSDLMPQSGMGEPISVTFEVNNNLMRNYTLGQQTLDAYSVSAGQRDVTGEISWQSTGNTAALGYVTIGGSKTMTASLDFAGLVTLDVTSGVAAVYGAQPPVLNVSDRVTSSCRFQLLSTTYGFMDLSIS